MDRSISRATPLPGFFLKPMDSGMAGQSQADICSGAHLLVKAYAYSPLKTVQLDPVDFDFSNFGLGV